MQCIVANKIVGNLLGCGDQLRGLAPKGILENSEGWEKICLPIREKGN